MLMPKAKTAKKPSTKKKVVKSKKKNVCEFC